MGKRTSYTPGTFSWVDLAATDAVAAKSFYAGVFGWEFEDTDAGGGAVYTMCRVGGDAVCGLYQMSDEVREEGASPNWLNYVTVADVDAAAARATEAGGAVLADAFDVLDAGRMAVLEDPQGAVFAVWLPRARIGAERVNDVGCLCMNELATTDMDAATRRVPGSPSSPAKSTRDPRLTGLRADAGTGPWPLQECQWPAGASSWRCSASRRRARRWRRRGVWAVPHRAAWRSGFRCHGEVLVVRPGRGPS